MQDDGKNKWMPPLGVCCSIAGDWAGDQIREPERWSEQAGPTGSVATATRAEETSVGIGVGTGMAVRGEWIGRRPWAQKASEAGGCSGHGPETGGWADLHNGERHRSTGGHAGGPAAPATQCRGRRGRPAPAPRWTPSGRCGPWPQRWPTGATPDCGSARLPGHGAPMRQAERVPASPADGRRGRWLHQRHGLRHGTADGQTGRRCGRGAQPPPAGGARPDHGRRRLRSQGSEQDLNLAQMNDK